MRWRAYCANRRFLNNSERLKNGLNLHENRQHGEEGGYNARQFPLVVSTMTPNVLRLADNLELDRGAYELRRSGTALRLSRIPMELLLLLVERRGELVTRNEIVERIWGKDVFLDTDNSINAAVRKLRQVLDDDPEQPRFVHTVTGMGYRFVASVT